MLEKVTVALVMAVERQQGYLCLCDCLIVATVIIGEVVTFIQHISHNESPCIPQVSRVGEPLLLVSPPGYDPYPLQLGTLCHKLWNISLNFRA